MLYMAKHLNLPEQLTRPWFNYLGGLKRRFELRGTLSEEVTSNRGMPEGCPLSIVGMIVVNWCHSQYMKAYASQVKLMVFVDNLSYVADDPGMLLHAYLTSQTFHALWGLQFDDTKTFAWGIHATDRQALRGLGLHVKKDTSELGGIMNYTCKQHVRLLIQRGESLEEKWRLLRSSMAPHFRKLWALPSVFWAATLHASANLSISQAYVQELRRKAMKGLKWQAAGTNAALKLSLSACPMADPGFYDLRTSIMAIQRVLTKSPELLHFWQYWQAQDHSKKSPGPLQALHHRLESLQWTVVNPPVVFDHQGFRHDFLNIDRRFFLHQLYDGWLQQVARQTRHKTMHDLQGLEPSLALLDHNRLPTMNYHRVLAIQSGAFVSASQHSRYDSSKNELCAICGETDDRRHWLNCPRFSHMWNAVPWNWQEQLAVLPDSLVYHLLPSRNQKWHSLRYEHAAQPAGLFDFVTLERAEGINHLFVDGSCYDSRCPFSARAAWSVVNASKKCIVASSHLQGPRQSIDRAELSALISAAAWGIQCSTQICIWSDSKSTVTQAEQIDSSRLLTGVEHNRDLWATFLEIIERAPELRRHYRWVPSHLAPEAMEDPFEDWVALWNSEADRVANETNTQRGIEYRKLCDQIRFEVADMADKIEKIRSFYLRVADTTLPSSSAAPPMEPSDLTPGQSLDSMFDDLPLTWTPSSHPQWPNNKFPPEATQAFLELLHNWDKQGEMLYQVTDLELCCALVNQDFSFPFWQATDRRWLYRTYSECFERPTLSYLARFVSVAIGLVVDLLGAADFRLQIESAPSLGIQMSCRGTLIRLPTSIRDQAAERLRQLCARRPIRRAADLSRPLHG